MKNIKVYSTACLLSEVEFLSPLSTKTLLMIAQEIAETKQQQISTKLKQLLHLHEEAIFEEEVEELSQQLLQIIQ